MRSLPPIVGTCLRSLSCPPALLPFLPGTSRNFGPPRRRATLLDYFSRYPGELRQIEPATPAPPVADCTHLRPYLARMRLRSLLPPAYVFTLPQARLLGSAGWIVGENDTFLTEASFWREPDYPEAFSTHWILQRKRSPSLRHLPGRTLSLASDFAIGGFGHFLHDSLPRLHLIEKAGYRLRDFDWLYLPRLESAATRRLVATLDFPLERIVQHDPAHDLQTDEIVASSYPGTAGHMPAYTPEFLRRRFPTGAGRHDRKIFLSRAGSRRDLAQRSQIERLLLQRGFELIHPVEHDAIAACSEARCVIAQEGANFMNTLFCPPGTQLLLLLPEWVDLPYAFTAAAACNHRLHVLETRPLGSDPQGLLTLDLARFTHMLDTHFQ